MSRWSERRRAKATARAARRAEGGQVVVLFALMLVVLCGLAGLAIDLGHNYVDRRGLQGGTDTAADAGAKMIAVNARTSRTYTDAQVLSAVGDVLRRAAAAGSSVSGYSASYTDASGNVLAAVGGGSIPPRAAGVQVTARYSHPTFFMQMLGLTSASEAATGTSVMQSIQTVSTSSPFFFPYGVWQKNCGVTPPRTIAVGDQVVFRSNSYGNSAAGCDPNFQITSNDFKGYFHQSAPSVSQGDTLSVTYSQGGNAVGQEPISQLSTAFQQHETVIMPVVDVAIPGAVSGSASLHDAGFVALTLNADYSTVQTSVDWTATVTAFIPNYPGMSGCPACPSPTSYGPVSVSLLY